MSHEHKLARCQLNNETSIQGGGKVALSQDLEDDIVDLLVDRRDPKRPLLQRPRSELAFSHNHGREQLSAHNNAHYRSKFLKQLVHDHVHHVLSRQLNQTNDNKTEQQTIVNETTAAAKGKIRIVLMEAIYQSNNTKWKSGSTGKTLVLERSTTVAALLQLAKEKLKTKATRCFYVEQKLECELKNNLARVKDGSILYVSRNIHMGSQTNETESKRNREDGHNFLPDPTAAVKQAYASRQRRQIHRRIVLSPNIIEPSDCTSKLPPLQRFRAQLPAAHFRNDILSALARSRVVVICGSTGCGKSTQVPQFLFEQMQASERDGNILVTQPRRVAAVTLADRVASERNEKAGCSVGYQVRLDAAMSDATRITYVTIGILLRKLTIPLDENEAPLSDVSHLVIDEVHERDINTDFCLTILRSVLLRNPYLKIVIMSATNTPDLFVRYFTLEKLCIIPQVIHIPSRIFQVDTVWLDEIEHMIGAKFIGWSGDMESLYKKDSDHETPRLSPRVLTPIDFSFVSRLVGHLVRTCSKDVAILIFLPGRAEIDALARALVQYVVSTPRVLDICKLHSTASRTMQKAAFQAAKGNNVKVILATNVAETSITIPDVGIVIDTGHVKESRFNSHTRMKELATVWTSRASMIQRAGRAGRTQHGTCYCLYTQTLAEKHVLEQTTPEILRTPLDEIVLQSCLLCENRMDRLGTGDGLKEGTAPVPLLRTTPDPPPVQSLIHACHHLIEIGALDQVSGEDALIRVKLTPLGYHLSHLPMDSKIGKILLVGCMLGCVEPSLTIAAALSASRSIFLSCGRPKQLPLVEAGFGGVNWAGGTVKGDSIAVVAAYNQWCIEADSYRRRAFAIDHGLDLLGLVEVSNLRDQFRARLVDAGFLASKVDSGAHSENALLTSCCIAAGLYPNIARLLRPVRGKLGFKGGRLLTKDGDVCIPDFGSFQSSPMRSASETGPDVYAVYYSKNQSTKLAIGIKNDMGQKQVRLRDVNFISRFALLLFGGNLEVRDNFIIVDKWLKFKVGDKGRKTAVLMTEFRRELDLVLIHQLSGTSEAGDDDVIRMVVRLLQNE